MSLLNTHISTFRQKLAHIDALPQLTIIGIIVGITVGLIIIAFRLLIEKGALLFLNEHSENFEALPVHLHFFLPFCGAILIGSIIHFVPKLYRDVSVGQVLERLHNYQGRMSGGNFLVQFFGGALCLITGQSVGREGPAVHLGASAASLIGQWMKLPRNSLRTLIGCGVAAAIAASFDTPVAGVIFSMEVVMMSYSIVGFIPIMMSAICGTLITRLVFDSAPSFFMAEVSMHGLWELAIMFIGGLGVGLAATLYMRLQLFFSRWHHLPIFWRLSAAGAITGLLALVAPEILGLGYDTISLALDQQLTITTLVLILFAKILATSFGIGMGLPGGLIGPQLFIGACLGAILGIVVNTFFYETSSMSLYVLLGMAAMMGAVINAPLAALIAILELTYSPSVLFPSLLIIVVSCISTRLLFRCEGIFIEQLQQRGKVLKNNPNQQALNSIGVSSVMAHMSYEDRKQITMEASDSLYFIDELATLYEAQEMLNREVTHVLYVIPSEIDEKDDKTLAIVGLITQQTIDKIYTS